MKTLYYNPIEIEESVITRDYIKMVAILQA